MLPFDHSILNSQVLQQTSHSSLFSLPYYLMDSCQLYMLKFPRSPVDSDTSINGRRWHLYLCVLLLMDPVVPHLPHSCWASKKAPSSLFFMMERALTWSTLNRFRCLHLNAAATSFLCLAAVLVESEDLVDGMALSPRQNSRFCPKTLNIFPNCVSSCLQLL